MPAGFENRRFSACACAVSAATVPAAAATVMAVTNSRREVIGSLEASQESASDVMTCSFAEGTEEGRLRANRSHNRNRKAEQGASRSLKNLLGRDHIAIANDRIDQSCHPKIVFQYRL